MQSTLVDSPLVDSYRQMLLIRRFEERCLELSNRGEIAGSVHLCLGQEAVPVGAVAALEDGDKILPTYRGHGWALARGIPAVDTLAEICHRADGVNGGRGGSAYLSAPSYGLLGENSIVGAGVPIGAGVALAAKLHDSRTIALTSIGDGAMSQGSVHEGMIFAATYQLPLVLICENNGWAEMTPSALTSLTATLAERAHAYGMPAVTVDGCDPQAVYEAVAAARDRAISGGGPSLLECHVPRLSGHYNRDIQHYRPADDIEAARAVDPIDRLRRRLLVAGIPATELEVVEARIDHTIDDATNKVRTMSDPDPASAADHVYGPTSSPSPARVPVVGGKEMTYQRAVNHALATELENRPEVVLYGEDVGAAGGIFGVTRGLQKTFGPSRVFDTPIAESAILGSAVGASLSGLRPVVEIMWGDFLWVAFDQLLNQAANVRYLSRGSATASIVVRLQQGATPGSCAQHSQSLEAMLAHVPGLRLGLPATPHDAYAMTRAAIADDDPTILVESRLLYQDKGPVDFNASAEAIGGARLHRDGKDLAMITWGATLHTALAAADTLASEGVDASVLDLRWLNPIDDQAIDRLVAHTGGRLLVLHEANLTGGFGAEVAARITEQHFSALTHPVVRIATPDTRIPAAPSLQDALLPRADAVVAAAHTLTGAGS